MEHLPRLNSIRPRENILYGYSCHLAANVRNRRWCQKHVDEIGAIQNGRQTK